MPRPGLEDFSRVCETVVSILGKTGRKIKYAPAPTKLYRPIVSVVAALSKRNDSFDFDLFCVKMSAV
jgi:hypothetical protein